MISKIFLLSFLIMLSIITITSNAQEPIQYISSVDVNVSNVIESTDVRMIEDIVMERYGVGKVYIDAKNKLIKITPDMNIGWINLFELEQRLNSLRQFTVVNMDVSAVGRLQKYAVDYYVGGVYQYSRGRYKLQIGNKFLLLAENDKLNVIKGFVDKLAILTGTVYAFSEGIPILEIKDYDDSIKAGTVVPELEGIRDQISSAKIDIDGFICATCITGLEASLKTEEGIDNVTTDLVNGSIIVTFKLESSPTRLVDVINRVNTNREYAVRKITVVAIGQLDKLPIRYHETDVHAHSHDRYKLQVGNDYIILSESDKLNDLVTYGYGKKVRVVGTVTAFNNRVPIMLIGYFEKPLSESEPVNYGEPLNVRAMSSTIIPEKPLRSLKDHYRIDSIRAYVDGLICATCAEELKADLAKEEWVQLVNIDASVGLLEVIPEQNSMFEIHDLWQRINTLRQYKTVKMDVIATGEIQKAEIVYQAGTASPMTHTRYKLSAGKYTGFILAENDMLDNILKSNEKYVTVVGTVTSFRGVVPIMEIVDFVRVEQRPEWMTQSSE